MINNPGAARLADEWCRQMRQVDGLTETNIQAKQYWKKNITNPSNIMVFVQPAGT